MTTIYFVFSLDTIKGQNMILLHLGISHEMLDDAEIIDEMFGVYKFIIASEDFDDLQSNIRMLYNLEFIPFLLYQTFTLSYLVKIDNIMEKYHILLTNKHIYPTIFQNVLVNKYRNPKKAKKLLDQLIEYREIDQSTLCDILDVAAIHNMEYFSNYLDSKLGPYVECCGQCLSTNIEFKCSKCQITQYCNKECQKKHWKEHKNYCK